MKFIKRINEGWSDDYVSDFSDNGFTIVEETPSSVKGSISKGKFLVTDLNNWFTEMTDKLSSEYKVLSTKTFFNSVTGNANFEVVVTETGLESIDINVDGTDIQFIPKTITYINHYTDPNSLYLGGFSVKGRLSNGQNKTFSFSFKCSTGDGTQLIYVCSLSNKSRGVNVTKENIEKIFTLFDSGQVKLSTEIYSTPFGVREGLARLEPIRAKISELM